MITLTAGELRQKLDECPPGKEGWQDYEDCALAVIRFLFVPPLKEPKVQSRTLHGTDRRDAIFPNRVADSSTPWGLLRLDYDAKLILVEFKNYHEQEIGKDEVDQTRNYMKSHMGRLGVVCCNKLPNNSAYQRRNTVFSEEKKVIVFLTNTDLKEMIDIKERGDDPAEFLLDKIELFLIEHE